MSKIVVALGAVDPFAAVTAVLLSATFQQMTKPDSYGWAELFEDRAWGSRVDLADRGRGQIDTFTPQWNDGTPWRHVPLARQTRVRVHVVEYDLGLSERGDDPVGDAEFGYEELTAALRQGGVFQVRTAEQTQRQLLFVGISVVEE